MQRMIPFLLLAALALFAGCAPRDPNLAVRGMGEFPRKAGDYTLSVATYGLDAEGRVQLVQKGDDSLTGFVTRTLGPKGYALKAAGPARYAVEVHLLCGNPRVAKKGILAEELRIPAALAGAGYSEQTHYWLPDRETASGSREALDPRDSTLSSRMGGGSNRESRNPLGGAPLGRNTPDFCQGRVLVVVTQAGTGAQREVFVGRAATDDCRAQAGCPLNVCRSALEQSLVELLEHRF
jgi:hypothetical protein